MTSFIEDEQTVTDINVLLDEFSSERGGIINDAVEFVKTDESGVAIMAKEALKAGSVVVGVPYDVLLSAQKVMTYEPLRRIFVEQEQLRDFPDEVLAIGIMHAAVQDLSALGINTWLRFPLRAQMLLYFGRRMNLRN